MEFDETIQEILKVFEGRKQLYRGIFLRTAFVRENGAWKNIMTIILPMDKPVSNDRKMDYGDFMILETNLLLDDFNSLITDILRKDEMTLGGYSIKFQKDKMLLPTYSYPWGENFVSSLGSGDIERLGLKWPSKVYVLGLSQSKDIPIIPLQQWVRKDLPLYANIYSAIENEFHITGLSSALYWLGKIIILLPDYRAHFNKLTVFHDSMTVHIEINPEFSEKLLIKYLNESWLGNEHPSAEIEVNGNSASIPLKNPPSVFYCLLLDNAVK
jgi:hypothetical protein